MRRFFVVLMILIASSACAQQGVLPYAIDSSGTPKPNSANKPLFVTPVGSTGGTATVLIPLPAIGLATRSFTLLATNTVTLLQSIASFSDRDIIWFQPRGKIFWSVLSGTSGTAAEMQASAYSMEAGDTPIPFRLMKTSNIAFVADSAAAATLTYTIGREQ